MGYMKEKVAYLRGLADGMEIGGDAQSKLLLAVSSDFDAEIADLYPEASLSFFYGNGAAFNKTGTLFLAADEGAYLYKVNQEGALEAVSAKYDEFEGAFAIRTKILGRYVVSDLPLL